MHAPVLVAALLLLAALPAVGVSPLDDDANTGGDAGDAPASATPLAPGIWRGSLTWPLDVDDVYAIAAHPGEGLHVVLRLPQGTPAHGVVYRPDGAPWQRLDLGSEQVALLDAEGPWFLGVHYDAIPPGTTDYILRFWTSPLGDSASASAAGGWNVLEVRQDAPGDLGAVVALRPFFEDAQPFAALLVLQFHLVTSSGGSLDGTAATHLGAGSQGRDLTVTPALVGPQPFPVLVSMRGDRGGWQQLTLLVPNVAGWVRLVAIADTPGTLTRLTATSTSSLVHATAQGRDLVAWDDATAATDLQVRSQELSLQGERDLRIALDSDFLGFFTPWLTTGNTTSPSRGTASYPPLLGVQFFFGAEPGVWDFHLQPAAGATVQTEHVYLDGAFVPHLGVAG